MMPLPKNVDPRVWTLTNALCSGAISESEMQQLEQLLDADPGAREFFVDFLDVNAEILWLISAKRHSTMDSGPPATLPTLLAPPSRPPILGFLGDLFNNHPLISFFSLFMIIGAGILAATLWSSPPRRANAPAEPEFVAQLTGTRECQWSSAAPAPTDMMQLPVGQKLALEKGLAQITYANGAVVLIEAPASYTVDSPKSGFLSHGKLTARADTEASRQFVIATPHARFVDQGTEFGVLIDDRGRAEVAVFEGKVNAVARLANGRWTAPVPLVEGQAAVCEGAKFSPQVVSRDDFPTLLPPPPPPMSPFQRWLEASHDLQGREDLVAYYDFQPDPTNPAVLFNRAPTGAALNGEIQIANWVEGRFPGKSALEFMAGASGVHVNIPSEYRQLTVIAWLSSNRLANDFNGILMSDNWMQNKELHWELQDDGKVDLIVYGQMGHHSSAESVPVDGLKRWCMLAGAVDTPANRISLYFNDEFTDMFELKQMPAVQIGSATIGGWNNEGKGDTVKVHNLCGRIDELMIFQRVLTPDEIKQVYETGKP